MKSIHEIYHIPDLGNYEIITNTANNLFGIWANGCCLGEHNNISAARLEIAKVIQNELIDKLLRAEGEVRKVSDVIEKLRMTPIRDNIPTPDPHLLGRYMV